MQAQQTNTQMRPYLISLACCHGNDGCPVTQQVVIEIHVCVHTLVGQRARDTDGSVG